jgi:hypothetical protein
MAHKVGPAPTTALEPDVASTSRNVHEDAAAVAEAEPRALSPGGATASGAGSATPEGAPQPSGEATRTPRLSWRRTLSMALVVVDVAVFVLAITHVHGPARLVLGLVLGMFIPGWSVVGLLKLGHAALEVSLAVAMSFVLLMLAAQVLMTVHQWHLQGLEEVVCVLCLPSLLWQSRRRTS